MAVAARPGPSDARVPCPLCGGLIHPIAGKCKHCKADLTAHRAARPAASTPLPALHRPAPNGHAPVNGHSAQPAIATAVAAHEAQPIQPVLPPQPLHPDERGHTAQPATSAWRSWPVLVIVIAMIAIVAAVVLMLWPESSRSGARSKRALQPPPAPERMPTQVPDPHTVPDRHPGAGSPTPSTAPDPWAMPSDPPAQDPSAKPDDDDASDDDLAPLKDPFSDSHASRNLRFNRPGALFATMVVHLCRKMLECGIDDPIVANQCDRFSRAPAPPSGCPAAARCLQRIDAMACGTQPALAHIATLLNQFTDCHDAIRC